MNLQHFVISGDHDLQGKAMNFLAKRKACQDQAVSGNAEAFKTAGMSMSRAYIELSQVLGVGAGIFAGESGTKATSILIERFKGEVVLRVPTGVKLRAQTGLEQISPDDYINMRANARKALALEAGASPVCRPSPFAQPA